MISREQNCQLGADYFAIYKKKRFVDRNYDKIGDPAIQNKDISMIWLQIKISHSCNVSITMC